jgi:predicted metal-dependent enzyme (double-stranded beta helix superfamily)
MTTATTEHPLIPRLREAVQLNSLQAITDRVKGDLETMIASGDLHFDERYHRARPDHYCRRLFYRDPELGFTAVVMTWGPGQRTALHDHAGIWCVEGVVAGEMEVVRYEMLEEDEGVCRFVNQGSLRALPGSAGALIPPFEHHVLGNPNAEQVGVTLHVYGGEMEQCCIFEPMAEAGVYRRCTKSLRYDEE